MAISKITTNSLADSAITSAKIADGTVVAVDIAAGSVGASKLDTSNSDGTGALSVPSGTTAQRPVSPTTGMIRYNTTNGVLEQYTTSGWVGIEPAPTITSVVLPGTQTAAFDGDTITINGTGFKSGATVKFVGPTNITTNASVVSFVSSNQLTAVIPTGLDASAEGTYQLVVNNPSGLGSTLTSAFSVDAIPVFTTAAGSIGSVAMGAAFSATIAATEHSSSSGFTFAVTSGTLPSGITINSSTGVISGTAPLVSSDTTYTFTVTATDVQNQSANRSFNMTVTWAQNNALRFG
jgi:large repetitive protein